MYKIERTHVDNLIKNGYNFELGRYLSEGFNFYSANYLKVFISSNLAAIIPLLSIVTVPNIFRSYVEIENNTSKEIDTIFKFDKVGPILVSMLVIFGMFILVMIPLGLISGLATSGIEYNYSTQEGGSVIENFGGVVVIIYAILAMVLLFLIVTGIFFTFPLILFSDYNGWEATTTSLKLARHKILHIFALSLVTGIIASLGIIACYIGIFLSLPLQYCVFYMAYKDILLDKSTEIEEIGAD